jgi:hypothetical protein
MNILFLGEAYLIYLTYSQIGLKYTLHVCAHTHTHTHTHKHATSILLPTREIDIWPLAVVGCYCLVTVDILVAGNEEKIRCAS